MGDLISKAAEPLLDVADQALKLVEDPVTALLPETEKVFSGLSQLLGSESMPSSPAEAADLRQAQELAQQLPRKQGVGKQATMVRLIEMLVGALEGVPL